MLLSTGFLAGPRLRREAPRCSQSSAPPRAGLPIRAPAPLALAGSPGWGQSRGHPKFCSRLSAPPTPRPGLGRPAATDGDPGRTARRLPPRAPRPRGPAEMPAARGGRRAPTSGRLPTWAAGAARLRSRRRQSPAGRVCQASARLPGPLRQAPPPAPRPRRLGLAPAPRPAPTLSQRPKQVQLQRQERPPSAPPARTQLCRRPPAALPRVPARALGRRAGSPGPPSPPLRAGRGPPRPPRARSATAAPGHAEEELPPPPPAPGLGPRERDGRAVAAAERPGAGAGGGGGARR